MVNSVDFKKFLAIFALSIILVLRFYSLEGEIPLVGNQKGEIEGSIRVFDQETAFRLFGGFSNDISMAAVPWFHTQYFRVPINVRVTNRSKLSIILDSPYVIEEFNKDVVSPSKVGNYVELSGG